MAAIYDIAAAMRNPDLAGNLQQGLQFGNALRDLADKRQEQARQDQIRQGLMQFMTPAQGATNVVGVNSLDALKNPHPAQPAGFDFKGASEYLASQGAFDDAGSLAKLRDLVSPQNSEYFGGQPYEATQDGKRVLIAMTKGGPVTLPYEPAAPKPKVKVLDDGTVVDESALQPGTKLNIGYSPAQRLMMRRMEEESRRAAVQTAQTAQQGDFKGENALRDEFNSLSKPWVSALENYNKVQASSNLPENATPEQRTAGDIALVYAYMKMQDPGSVVREGEFATAQNAAGIPDRLRNQYNKLLSGQFLTPEQRSAFLMQSKSILEQQRKLQKQNETRYRDLAGRYRLNPDNVITSFEPSVEPPPGAVNALRQNPSLRAQFDSKYGAGASDRYLSNLNEKLF